MIGRHSSVQKCHDRNIYIIVVRINPVKWIFAIILICIGKLTCYDVAKRRKCFETLLQWALNITLDIWSIRLFVLRCGRNVKRTYLMRRIDVHLPVALFHTLVTKEIPWTFRMSLNVLSTLRDALPNGMFDKSWHATNRDRLLPSVKICVIGKSDCSKSWVWFIYKILTCN